jgi:hypothetical protein
MFSDNIQHVRDCQGESPLLLHIYTYIMHYYPFVMRRASI